MQHSPLHNGPKVVFEVSGEPVPKGRPRMTKTGHVYTPKKTATYERKVALLATIARQGAHRKPFTGPVGISAVFRFGTKRRIDIDNVLKAVLDSLNGILYEDDSQVMEIQVRKVMGSDEPGAHIVVTELNWEG
jgi:Holliday junction resolvase RusA-like endonuclease